MKINLGIIGCGEHAIHHANAIGEAFKITSVWDPNKKAVEKITSQKKADTLEELLADKDVKAVMIGSPDEYHFRQIEMALNAGKHVFCEKPLIVPHEPIKQLESAFDFAKGTLLVLTSCHPRRFDRPAAWLKENAFNPKSQLYAELGKVVSFSFDFSYHKPSSDWKHTRSLLLDHINHEVDLMNYLFGIKGFLAWQLHNDFDHYQVAGRREDGIAFHFTGTRRLEAKKYPEWCRIRFEGGEILQDMMTGTITTLFHETGKTTTVPGAEIEYTGRLEGVMRAFASQIMNGGPGYLSRAEMLMNTEAGILLQNKGIQRIRVRS